jgi:hypothetical protein
MLWRVTCHNLVLLLFDLLLALCQHWMNDLPC